MAHKRWICATIFALISSSPAWAASGSCLNDPNDPSGFYRTLHWKEISGSQEARGLSIFECSFEGFTNRVFVVTPTGRSILLTKVFSPHKGTEVFTWMDEETGWWLRLTKEFGLTWPTLEEYFDADFRELAAGPGRPVTLSVSTSRGFSYSTQVALHAQAEGETREFLSQLVSHGDLSDLLLATMSSELRADILFLSEIWSDPRHEGAIMKPIVEIVGGALQQTAGAGSSFPTRARWKQIVGELRKGTTVTNPEDLGFLSRFPSVSTSDPLAGTRVRDVFLASGES